MKNYNFPKKGYLASCSHSCWAFLFMVSYSGCCCFVRGVDITGSGTLGFLHGIGCSLKSWSRNWVWGLGGHWNLITVVEACSYWKEVQDDALLGAGLTVTAWDTPGWGGLVKLSKIELVENGRAGFAGPIKDVLALAGWDALTALDWAVLEWGQTG
jgi:hypothetical protein